MTSVGDEGWPTPLAGPSPVSPDQGVPNSPAGGGASSPILRLTLTTYMRCVYRLRSRPRWAPLRWYRRPWFGAVSMRWRVPAARSRGDKRLPTRHQMCPRSRRRNAYAWLRMPVELKAGPRERAGSGQPS